MKKITHIIANGCSWTYGQGLPNIREQNFLALLGKMYNVPVVNLALPGHGNESITRRTYEYFYMNKINSDSNPLFIINFSQYWRKEHWYNYAPSHLAVKNEVKDFFPLKFPHEVEEINDDYQRAFLENYNPEDFIRRAWMQKLFLINLFSAHNVNAIISDFGNCDDWINEFDKVKNKFPALYKNILHSNYVNSINLGTLLRDFPITPCLHVGPEGNEFLAKFMKEQIDRRFPGIQFEANENHIKVKDLISTSYEYNSHIHWH